MPKIYSMTGYGRACLEKDPWRVSVDIRSVNSRFFDFRPKLPRVLLSLEPKLRGQLQAVCSRGVFDLSVNIQPTQALTIDTLVSESKLHAYLSKARELTALAPSQVWSIVDVMHLPGVIGSSFDQNLEAWLDQNQEVILSVSAKALDSLLSMRLVEGRGLATGLRGYLVEIKEVIERLRKVRQSLNVNYETKILERLRKWSALEEKAIDSTRLHQEIAFYIDRSDVTEELDRLASHIGQIEYVLTGQGLAGKKLEFLLQEVSREINTIGSKSDDFSLSKDVVDMKLILEKMREQAQNLE